MVKENNISKKQFEFVENKEVFSRVVTSLNGEGKDGTNCQGVLFLANNIKLLTKEGGDVLSFLGVRDSEYKLIENGNQYFMPTTFEELVLGFKYTDCKGLQEFFRMGQDNNANLNAVICSFLKNNLEESDIDVKSLLASSEQIKQVIDSKANEFYDKKEDIYTKKILKYQSKMEQVRLERNGLDENGQPYLESESLISTVLHNFPVFQEDATQSEAEPILKVEDVLKFFNEISQAEASDTTIQSQGSSDFQAVEQ